MASMILEATKREGKAKQIRKRGLVPGVIYGEGIKTEAVQFDMLKIKPIINSNLKTSTLKVKLGDKVSHCIVKKVERDSVKGNITHLDIQAIDEDEKVKVKVPIIFDGKGLLKTKGLLLQVLLSELEVSGSAEKLPEEIRIDLSHKKYGDKVLVSDIKLNKDIVKQVNNDEVIAVITGSEQIPESDEE